MDFIRTTQTKTWEKLEALHGDKTGERVLEALCKWMDREGALATLRHGFKCFGKTLRIAFFRPAHGLNPDLEARFQDLQEREEEEAELGRGKTQASRNLFSFLSQVIPYQDSDLEKLYTYLRHLALKLPKRKSGPGYHFDEEVELDYYRLQKISEGSISLSEGVAKPLDGPREVGSGMVRDEDVPLSSLIDIINEGFGSELTEADQLFFDQLATAAMLDDVKWTS